MLSLPGDRRPVSRPLQERCASAASAGIGRTVVILAASLVCGGAFGDGMQLFGGNAEPPKMHQGVDVPQPLQRPAVVYVTDFYLDPERIQRKTLLGGEGPLRRKLAELRGDDPATRAKALVKALAEAIVQGLKDGGQAAEYLPAAAQGQGAAQAGQPLPKQGWLVGGWFVSVNEGNRALAATLGFGTGAESVEIQVTVADLGRNASEPFLFMGSSTQSKLRPGGLIMGNPLAVAAKYVISRGATEADAKKQGAAIAKGLLGYLATKPSAGGQR